jgi:rhodanese-related sulfurtransferase
MESAKIVSKEMITQDELVVLVKDREEKRFDFALIDVREAEEYNSAKIDECDFFMPLSKFEEYLDDVKKIDKPLVIYCRTDRRSKMIYQYLEKNGIKSCFLKGGITDYKGKII